MASTPDEPAAERSGLVERRSQRRRAIAIAVGTAVMVHTVAIVVLDHQSIDRWFPGAPPAGLAANGAVDPVVPTPTPAPLEISVVSLVDEAHMPPPLAVWGTADEAGFADTHPLPNASADRPGDLAADRGGGGTGGVELWTGRRDDPDDATLRAEPWNDGRDYRAAHDRNAARSSSVEALHRQREPDAGDRQVQPLAHQGGEIASRGATDGIGAGDGDALWRYADPRFGLRPGRDQDVRQGGSTRPDHQAAFSDAGKPSADVIPRGLITRDHKTVAAASTQTAPDPYDLTPVSSGGTDRGVAGAAGDGSLADGRGNGDAATRADAHPGGRDLAIKATPQDPYFRELFKRLSGLVQFPHDLALELRSGRSIVRFVLAADGKVSDIALHSSSGYRGFDVELLHAVGQLRDLGPVPARLLDGRTALKVLVPYEFQNPVVR